jgi:hypothetical protein
MNAIHSRSFVASPVTLSKQMTGLLPPVTDLNLTYGVWTINIEKREIYGCNYLHSFKSEFERRLWNL